MKLMGLFVAMLCTLTGCFPTSLLSLPEFNPTKADPMGATDSQLHIDGQLLSPDQIQDFLIQKLKQNGQSSQIPARDWRGGIPQGYKRTPELRIQDIQLAETGQSILGPQALAALVPELDGQPVELVLTGTFTTKQDQALKLKTFLFTLEPPLLHQSLAPGSTEPLSRVVLDDAILLTPVSVSDTEIRVRLNPRGLLDLMLAGTHKLSLLHRGYYTDALMKVARPIVPPGDLQPVIRTVEVIRNTRREPQFIKAMLDHAMTQPKFSYATVDGIFGFGYQTQVLDTEAGPSWEVLIHVPDPVLFDQRPSHSLTYSTPFGTAYRQF